MKESLLGLTAYGFFLVQGSTFAQAAADVDMIAKYGFPAAFAIMLGFLMKTVKEDLNEIKAILRGEDLQDNKG